MDRNLRAFLAVARTGNLTAAADRIGLTQPALTKTIRRVELDFGAKLFERTTRGMFLTPAGKLLLERAERIELHYQQGKEEIQLIETGVPEEFRIAAGVAYHIAIAPDLVKRLSLEFPKTRFALQFQVAGHAMPRLMSGEVDLVLGALDHVPLEGLETLPLLHVEMTVYACAESALGRAEKATPQMLAGKRWVVYQRDPVMLSRMNSYAAEHRLPPPDIVMEIDSLLASFRAVRGTDYVTSATSVVRDAAAEEGLKMLELDQAIWYFDSGASYRRSHRDYAIMQRALAILQELTEGHAAHHSRKL